MNDPTGTTTRSGQISRPDIRQTGLLSQSVAIARRNFIHIKRMPEMLLDVTIQPVMFVLLFAFVFGSSIDIPIEGGYEAFLLPGIMAQTVAFSAFIVAVGLTADLDKGIVDRMRSLPINPAAVLVGRSFSSVAHSSIGLVVMSLTGLTIGWGIHTDVLRAALGYLLLVGWAFAMIWIGIWVGSAMRSVEAVNGVMFATMFPITFLANTFAPTNTMPDWLRTVAEWNPISSLTQAVRELWGNDMPLHADAELPLRYPIVFTIGWIIVITAVVAPLAIRTFRARTAD